MSQGFDREVVLELHGASKTYRGRAVLRDVDLTLHAGEVLGFVGPNGAGKTTLLKIVSGLTWPSSGTGYVLGHEIAPGARPAPFLGMMLERPAFIEHRSGRDNLRLLASLRGCIEDSEIADAMRAVGLDPDDRRPTRAYSLGMRQRLSFAQAMMERPRILLLDEPTNGLDPTGIIDTRLLIQRLAREQGTAVLLASHMLAEVEAVCDAVVLVEHGVVQRTFSPAESDAGPLMLDVELAKPEQVMLISRLRDLEVVSADAAQVRLRCSETSAAAVIRELVFAGIDIEGATRVRRHLEDVYLSTIEGGAR